MITSIPLLNPSAIPMDKMTLNEQIEFIDRQLLDQPNKIDLEVVTKSKDIDPDSTYTFEQLADEYGFVADSYKVVTEDGYELKMFRLK